MSCQRKWTLLFKDLHLFVPLVWNTAWKLSAVYGSFLSCVQSHQHEQHSGRKRCVGSRARIESYSSLLSSFAANVFPHKLADNNPDSQNNLCKPTQWQRNLNVHKRALMGWASGDRSIARKQGLLSVSLDLRQAKLLLYRTFRKRCSMLVDEIIEDLNDNVRPQSGPMEFELSQWGLGCTAKDREHSQEPSPV